MSPNLKTWKNMKMVNITHPQRFNVWSFVHIWMLFKDRLVLHRYVYLVRSVIFTSVQEKRSFLWWYLPSLFWCRPPSMHHHQTREEGVWRSPFLFWRVPWHFRRVILNLPPFFAVVKKMQPCFTLHGENVKCINHRYLPTNLHASTACFCAFLSGSSDEFNCHFRFHITYEIGFFNCYTSYFVPCPN